MVSVGMIDDHVMASYHSDAVCSYFDKHCPYDYLDKEFAAKLSRCAFITMSHALFVMTMTLQGCMRRPMLLSTRYDLLRTSPR